MIGLIFVLVRLIMVIVFMDFNKPNLLSIMVVLNIKQVSNMTIEVMIGAM